MKEFVAVKKLRLLILRKKFLNVFEDYKSTVVQRMFDRQLLFDTVKSLFGSKGRKKKPESVLGSSRPSLKK